MKEDKATEKAKKTWSGHSFVPSEIEYMQNYAVPKPDTDTRHEGARDNSTPKADPGKEQK